MWRCEGCKKDLLRGRKMANAVIRDVLERSIDELPDDLRIVFVACVIGGITPERCAELLALTSDTVEACLHNAPDLVGEMLVGQLGPAFGGSYELDDSRSERITKAVMDRLFTR
jgi:hypothetical protein